MDKNIIHCPACESENLNSAVYCSQCGLPLREGVAQRYHPPVPAPFLRPGPVILLALLAGGLLSTALHLFILPAAHDRVTKATSSEIANESHTVAVSQSVEPEITLRKNPTTQANLAAPRPPATQRPRPSRKQEPLLADRPVIGMVSIIDPWDRHIAAVPAAVINGAWLALPTRAGIGGVKWLFRPAAGIDIALEGGLWQRGDGVGLWRLAGEKSFQGPDLAPWNEEEPVSWISLRTGETGEVFRLYATGRAGIFSHASLSSPLEAGLFLQHGKVVGWTFGDWLEGAYMWNQVPGIELVYENYVEDFYSATFAGGREELFARALAMDEESSPVDRLWAFADAFHLNNKLAPEEVPEHLRPENVYPAIRRLIFDLVHQDLHNVIASLAPEPLLWELRDAELLTAVIRAIEKSRGAEAALDFFEGSGAELRRNITTRTAALERLHLELYLNTIGNRLDKNELGQAWRVYSRAQDYFDQSPELHLLAVELALAGRDWAEAERLLYQRDYPPALREKKMRLGARISELKGLEGRIVIHFPPGSSNIPVDATINDRRRHDFMIDTGASFVTIPAATATELGLADEAEYQLRTVQTAGGSVTAPTVTLASIELQGWVVSNVEALVIDIPDHPGLGLLGLNFLNNFRMDLKPEQGLLLLDPQ